MLPGLQLPSVPGLRCSSPPRWHWEPGRCPPPAHAGVAKSFNIYCGRVSKGRGAHCFAPKGGKSWSFPTPATLTPGGLAVPGRWARGEAAHGHQKQSLGFWQWHHGVIAAPPRKTSSWSPEGILCGAGTDVAHLGSTGPGGVQTSRSCSMSQARRSRQLRASRGAWAQRRRLSDGW